MKALACVFALAALVSCTPAAEQAAVDKDNIRQSLQTYLPKLAEAYATGEVEPLRGLAADKELASVDKLILELAQAGRVMKPELKELTLEEVTVWQSVNAYVTTVEVWDIKVYAAGSERLVSQEDRQRSRVRYQMKRDGDRWRVLYRERQIDALGAG